MVSVEEMQNQAFGALISSRKNKAFTDYGLCFWGLIDFKRVHFGGYANWPAV